MRALIAAPTPFFLFSKPEAGTGATLCTEALVSLATGQDPAVHGGSKDDAEWVKKITAILVRAPSVVLFDNLGGVLDSDGLSRALTGLVWEDRVLGESRDVRCPIQVVWLGTANNLALGKQMVRRVVPSRMDAECERPWMLVRDGRVTYKHPALLAWVQAERPRLVHACLTLCTAWVAAGRPRGAATMGTYPEWAALVGGVLEVAGWSGFLANLDEFYDAADVEVDEKKPFLAAWWIAFTTTPVEARTLFHRLVGRGALLGDESIMTLSLGGKDDGGSPKAMGQWLLRHRDQTVELGVLPSERAGTPAGPVTVKILRAGGEHRPAWRLIRVGGGRA